MNFDNFFKNSLFCKKLKFEKIIFNHSKMNCILNELEPYFNGLFLNKKFSTQEILKYQKIPSRLFCPNGQFTYEDFLIELKKRIIKGIELLMKNNDKNEIINQWKRIKNKIEILFSQCDLYLSNGSFYSSHFILNECEKEYF